MTTEQTNNPKTIRVMMVDDEPIIRKAVKMELNERHAMVMHAVDDNGTVEPVEIVVGETFSSGAQLFAALSDGTQEVPHYLLLDMELQGEPTGGLFVAERVHQRYPDVGIIILSGRFDNPLELAVNRENRVVEIGRVVFEALNRGASAFVSKNAVGGFSIDNIVQAIASLERGEKYYFNYPVMLTIKEAAEHYFRQHEDDRSDLQVSPEEKEILLLEASGCTAQEIADHFERETDKSIQEKQKDLSRKMDIVNKSGARIAKAIQYGLINPREIKFLKR